jgi:hypothetical protein
MELRVRFEAMVYVGLLKFFCKGRAVQSAAKQGSGAYIFPRPSAFNALNWQKGETNKNHVQK